MNVSPKQSRTSEDASQHHSQSGMTIIELMAAMTIGIILLTMVFQFFIFSVQNFNEGRMTSEMQQELRWASTYISDRLKMAGNGVPQMSVFRVINNYDGGSGSDSVVVIGSYKSLVLTTTQAMGNKGSQVKVNDTSGIEAGDLIVISYPPGGWQELFLVTSIQNILHLWHAAAPPWNDDNQLNHTYPIGSLCTVVTHYSFFVQTDDEGHSNLMVQTQVYPPQILAGDIEDFQLRFKLRDGSWVNNPDNVSDIRMMEISLRARTPDPIQGYRNPVYDDEYKRIVLRSNIIPKNITLVNAR